MRKLTETLVLFLVGLAGCSSNKAAHRPPGDLYLAEQGRPLLEERAEMGLEDEYVIGVGDRLDVVFPFDRELTTNGLIVRSDGRISLPYVGDIMAAGFTPMGLDSALTARFSEILRTPEIAVIVRSSAEKVVYVLGEVKKPGGYPFEFDISLLQAIALAGGFKEGAKPDHTVVIRRVGEVRIVGIEVDAKSLAEEGMIQKDIFLKNHDIVFIPKSRIQSVADFASKVYEIIGPPFSMYIRGWELKNLQATYEYYLRRGE